MKFNRSLCLLLALACASPSTRAASMATDSCNSLDTWDILDLDGDGSARIVTDH